MGREKVDKFPGGVPRRNQKDPLAGAAVRRGEG